MMRRRLIAAMGMLTTARAVSTAWWRSIGKVSGYFKLYGPTPGDDGKWDGTPGCQAPRGPLQMCSSDTLPLEGRWHDGHVKCDDGNATGDNCRGFIEATYTYGDNARWFLAGVGFAIFCYISLAVGFSCFCMVRGGGVGGG